jgi:hypothetical protein
MIQNTTKITIEFIAPVDNSEGVVKITSNEYGQELTNETTVKAVIWEAYRNSLINSVRSPVEGFENDNKAILTLNTLILEQSNKVNRLAKQCGYNVEEKLQSIVKSITSLETESAIYSELIKLEREVRDYAYF